MAMLGIREKIVLLIIDSNTYFLLNLEYEGGQLSKKIDSYIRNNYKKVKVFNNLILYKRG